MKMIVMVVDIMLYLSLFLLCLEPCFASNFKYP
jgi:hypothetical protein